MINKIVVLLEALLKLNRSVEGLLVDVIASFSPWAAPMIPAYLVYRGMVTYLEFPGWVAMAGALTVETLGLSAIQTSVSFWSWNASKAKTDPRAPVALALMTGAFYLSVVLSVNTLLDPQGGIYAVSKGLLSSLSVCAGVVISLRAGHARRLREVELLRAERKAERAILRQERRAARMADPLPISELGRNGNSRRSEALTR